MTRPSQAIRLHRLHRPNTSHLAFGAKDGILHRYRHRKTQSCLMAPDEFANHLPNLETRPTQQTLLPLSSAVMHSSPRLSLKHFKKPTDLQNGTNGRRLSRPNSTRWISTRSGPSSIGKKLHPNLFEPSGSSPERLTERPGSHPPTRLDG